MFKGFSDESLRRMIEVGRSFVNTEDYDPAHIRTMVAELRHRKNVRQSEEFFRKWC